MRFGIAEATWDILGPMARRCQSHLGPAPGLPERIIFEAVLFRPGAGYPWRDLPGDFDGRSAVYKRIRRWIASGRPARLCGLMAAPPTRGGTLRVMIGSRPTCRRISTLPRPPNVQGETAGNAIGRSRGGLSAKVIIVATDEDGVVAVDVAQGQSNDAPLALPVLARAEASLGRIDEVLGDKGFDSDEVRDVCMEEHGALPAIPNWKSWTELWPWDEVMRETYKQRNRIKRAFAEAKQFRRFATGVKN